MANRRFFRDNAYTGRSGRSVRAAVTRASRLAAGVESGSVQPGASTNRGPFKRVSSASASAKAGTCQRQ
jgi:hypothetical protein